MNGIYMLIVALAAVFIGAVKALLSLVRSIEDMNETIRKIGKDWDRD